MEVAGEVLVRVKAVAAGGETAERRRVSEGAQSVGAELKGWFSLAFGRLAVNSVLRAFLLKRLALFWYELLLL